MRSLGRGLKVACLRLHDLWQAVIFSCWNWSKCVNLVVAAFSCTCVNVTLVLGPPFRCWGIFCRNSIPTFWKFCVSNFPFIYCSRRLPFQLFFFSPALLSLAAFLPPLLIFIYFVKHSCIYCRVGMKIGRRALAATVIKTFQGRNGRVDFICPLYKMFDYW